jgi:hypothetical protein
VHRVTSRMYTPVVAVALSVAGVTAAITAISTSQPAAASPTRSCTSALSASVGPGSSAPTGTHYTITLTNKGPSCTIKGIYLQWTAGPLMHGPTLYKSAAPQLIVGHLRHVYILFSVSDVQNVPATSCVSSMTTGIAVSPDKSTWRHLPLAFDACTMYSNITISRLALTKSPPPAPAAA